MQFPNDRVPRERFPASMTKTRPQLVPTETHSRHATPPPPGDAHEPVTIPPSIPLVTAGRKIIAVSDLPAAADLPAILEGNAALVARVVARWKSAEENGAFGAGPAMSMAAWNALGADGSVLDDETGKIVGRVDVGWFLQRGRAKKNDAIRPNVATSTDESPATTSLPPERTQRISGFVRKKDASLPPIAARRVASR